MDTFCQTPRRAAALVLAAIGLVLLLAPPAAAAADNVIAAREEISTTVAYEPQGQLRLLGQTGGQLTAVAVDAGYAFIGEGERLTAWAVGPDGPPRRLAATPLLGDLVRDIEVVTVAGRRLAAVTVSRAGLVILDLTDPAQPSLLSRLATAGSAQRVARGPQTGRPGLGLLYITDEPQGLWVVDASDPAAPVDHGIRYAWWTPMNDLAVAGTTLYTVYSYNGYDGGIESYDVSDPLAPRWVAGRDRDDKLAYAYDVSLVQAGTHVYVYVADLVLDAAPGAGFKTVRQIPELEDHADAWRTAGARAYTIHAGQLLAYDVSQPASPVGLGGYPFAAGALAVADGIAVVAQADGRIEAVDVGTFNVLRLANVLGGNQYRDVDEIVLRGDRALVAHRLPDRDGRLTVFDITNPEQPVAVSTVSADYVRLEAGPTYAFLIDEYTLTVLDWSHPPNLRERATLQADPFTAAYGYLAPADAAHLDQRLYVAARGGLVIYDLGQAGAPVVQGLFPTPARAAAWRCATPAGLPCQSARRSEEMPASVASCGRL